ncbi:MAG: dihydrolipoyllysine-residue acetyltransferase [Gammaproteobacteria bacterium]|nr:dihydrolipoyllysine-residue acetyltransferase [Gammaproteobacteria bacterium]
MAQEILIPDIGDIDEVEVIEICAAAGDQVGPDDALIVIESDKASMEVPAGIGGVVEAVTVAVGDTVAEGHVIARIELAALPVSDAQEPVADESRGEEVSVSVPDAEVAASPSTGGELEIRVPDIGEAEDVVVIEVAVTAGQAVSADDLVVVVESDKASMEIPAGHAGTVLSVHVSDGSEVTEGTLLVTLGVDGAAQAPPVADESLPPQSSQVAAAGAPDAAGSLGAAGSPGAAGAEQTTGSRVYAGPAVRRLARELGVELESVSGSGGRGRIVKDDVKSFVKSRMKGAGAPVPAAGGIPQIPEVDFSKFGPVETEPLSRIRAAGAGNLHRSWLNVPHVTQHDEADLTELEAFRATLKEEAARRSVRITPLAFIVKACCYALKEFPTFNASLDQQAKNFILKRYYHIGFAVDTDEGLVVPVIKDADQMGIWELSGAIAELAEKARTQKLGMGDMQGASFSVSSLGAIGGTAFTPIINAPEVAILGVARLATKPVWDGETFVPRKLLPLSLSYDHRAINGAEAGRFVSHLSELLADIRRLSL